MNKFFEDLFVAKDKIISIKKETTKQATCNKWESLRENRITSNDAHKVLIPKKRCQGWHLLLLQAFNLNLKRCIFSCAFPLFCWYKPWSWFKGKVVVHFGKFWKIFQFGLKSFLRTSLIQIVGYEVCLMVNLYSKFKFYI